MTATFYVGDAIEVMNKLPAASVDLVLSSPPFLALRSYLPVDHPSKALEGGSQATPGEYIDWLVDVAEACARVLAPHGSLCFELGDTYAGSGDNRPTRSGWHRSGNEDVDRYRALEAVDTGSLNTGPGWPLSKSLSLIPELFRFTLVYGFNPLTGRQTDRWRLRNVIRWVRPNPPVGALGDKFRPATSELMVFCKSAKRYFDLDAVREPWKYPDDVNRTTGAYRANPDSTGYDPNGRVRVNSQGGAPPLDWWETPAQAAINPCEHGRLTPHSVEYKQGQYEHRKYKCPGGSPVTAADFDSGAPALEVSLLDDEAKPYGPKTPKQSGGPTGFGAWDSDGDKSGVKRRVENTIVHELGAPPLDWWNIPPGGYEGAHYAVFPPELCVRPIKAMCPEKVCRTCGEPRRRIVETSYERMSDGSPLEDTDGWRTGRGGIEKGLSNGKTPARSVVETLGFSDCGHDNYRPGLVLDCFVGSGTVLAVATGHGREAIGIDLDERNYDLALERVGPFILERAR